MQLPPQQQQEGKQAWDATAGPPIGSHLDCLDVFPDLQVCLV